MLVPKDAKNINFGVLHPGDGSAWFDSLQVEIDGSRYTDTSRFDLDFESETARGFFTGGQGYEVTIDKQAFHSGKQSLRSSFTARDSGIKPLPDPHLLAIDCQRIVDHLEILGASVDGREDKRKELEWVTQNARLVLEYVQLNAGTRTRDESMADNIKWIADQNPGAKIIVWAHNGHIAHGGTWGYRSMGSYLRKMLGPQYVDFGFAFSQGSFQAVDRETSKGLHDFSLGPAPDDSLDATLASAGLPILALDLRTPPKDTLAASWLKAAHPTRSIGALFSVKQAEDYFVAAPAPEMFDVLLFVANTTAARKLAPSGSP